MIFLSCYFLHVKMYVQAHSELNMSSCQHHLYSLSVLGSIKLESASYQGTIFDICQSNILLNVL